jgi:yecA family protein
LAVPDMGGFMPPNLLTMGAVPFGSVQLSRLRTWLREAGWPREHMEIAALEGYLVALIAWPVGISPGAWLPPIWGERGWKIPRKIATRAQYDEFIALIAGFMQCLDRDLAPRSARFESSVLRGLQGHEYAEALHGWGKGFMTALTLGAQGLKWRSEGAGAVRRIASVTSWSTPARSNAVDSIANAVRLLMEHRASRGPLGPLDAVLPLDSTHTADG